MVEPFDFERYWLNKFSGCLEQEAGAGVRDAVMAGSEFLSDATPRDEVIAWSQGALERLAARVDEASSRRIMAGCACQYGKEELQDVRAVYQATGNVARAHALLQERFEAMLVDSLKLEPSLVDEIFRRGWGLAGVLEGDTIIATKIPKSGFLVEYLDETDPAQKRAYYCHCPRVRDSLRTEQRLPVAYCYCGAGYYQSIWQEVLQRPVEVEVRQSVLQGDDVCTIAIYLSPRHS